MVVTERRSRNVQDNCNGCSNKVDGDLEFCSSLEEQSRVGRDSSEEDDHQTPASSDQMLEEDPNGNTELKNSGGGGGDSASRIRWGPQHSGAQRLKSLYSKG